MSYELYNAADYGTFEEVERLLAQGGVDVNYKDRDYGDASLHRAAYNGRTRIAYTLILSGADLLATANDGGTAAQFALYNNPVLAACLDRLAAPQILAACLDRLAAPQTTITLSSAPQQPLQVPLTPQVKVPLTVYFFFAGLPLQPNPQPAYHTIVHHEGLWLAVIVPWLQDVALPLYATQPKVKAFVDTMLQNVVAMHSVPDGAIQFLAATFPDAVEAMTKEFVQTTLQNALSKNHSVLIVQFLVATFPDAMTKEFVQTALQNALSKNYADAAVQFLVATFPNAVEAMPKEFVQTTLQNALSKNHSDLIVQFLVATFPDAVEAMPKEFVQTTLQSALSKNHSDLIVQFLVATFPDAVEAMPKEFVQTTLQNALSKNHSDLIVQFLVATFPDAAEAMPKEFVHKTLLNAVAKICSDVVVRVLLATFPDAVKAMTEVTTHRRTPQPTGGDTVLHKLAAAKCSTTAECRHTNTLCFLLVQKGASPTNPNAEGQTPAERASKGMLKRWNDPSGPLNNHFIATLGEVVQFKRKKHRHLSLMHFRDWTTVSHAWSTPSAKFVALTVLLAGETYKRGLLPRLPMDCWYKILNCIPRHQLRLGECDPEAEQEMMAKYVAILNEAKVRIDAGSAAAGGAGHGAGAASASVAAGDGTSAAAAAPRENEVLQQDDDDEDQQLQTAIQLSLGGSGGGGGGGASAAAAALVAEEDMGLEGTATAQEELDADDGDDEDQQLQAAIRASLGYA